MGEDTRERAVSYAAVDEDAEFEGQYRMDRSQSIFELIEQSKP